MILIPANYWDGQDTLNLGYPWLTPGSIHFLDQTIKPDLEVLEYGCGGSTIFFSKRTKHVFSFETNPNWYAKVKTFLETKNIINVSLNLVKQEDDCVILTKNRSFDIILVDCEPSVMNRDKLLMGALPLLKENGLIILDNYSACYCTNKDDTFRGWRIDIYDDPHWTGKGTKIYRK